MNCRRESKNFTITICRSDEMRVLVATHRSLNPRTATGLPPSCTQVHADWQAYGGRCAALIERSVGWESWDYPYSNIANH